MRLFYKKKKKTSKCCKTNRLLTLLRIKKYAIKKKLDAGGKLSQASVHNNNIMTHELLFVEFIFRIPNETLR
jgi:hypothetical protein